jgi:NAD-dependent dihydropyrimidine dehydrogenase PreA subunit
MTAIINFKICDNSPQCDGLAICPVKAITWNKNKKTLEIDESKCTNCGACAKSCSVGAIKVATGAELELIKEEYKNDKRSITALFVERYGSSSINPSSLISSAYLEKVIDSNSNLIIELFSNDSAKCLVKSIPTRNLFGNKSPYFKIDTDQYPELIKKYEVKEIPCLLFFKNKKLIKKIEGYYGLDRLQELKSIVSSLI